MRFSGSVMLAWQNRFRSRCVLCDIVAVSQHLFMQQIERVRQSEIAKVQLEESMRYRCVMK